MPQIIARLLIAICLVVGAGHASHAFEIRQCEPQQMSDVLVAATFIDQNLTTMVGRMSFLEDRQRKEITRKWPRLTLRCRERGACRITGVQGFAHGGLGNAVNVCHATMVDIGATLCNLIETIVHESGHAHGFPSLPGHNNPTPAIQASDVIFRMGATAFDVCSEAVTAGTFANRALQGFPRVGLGGACNRDPDCQSSNCRDGHCICVQDSDCGSGRICERLGRNTCLSSRLANGASCQRDRQCTSGRCRRDRCS